MDSYLVKNIALIPTRLESSRLPGKPLLEIDGLPIIIHTAKRAQLSKKIDEVYVCTHNDEIIKICKKFNIQTIKTGKNFLNGTERISSVCQKFKNCLIVDVQGDEPLIQPDFIDQVIKFHTSRKNKADIIIPTISVPYSSPDTIVRVVTSISGRVMTLTRGNIPHFYKNSIPSVAKHVSVISFTYNALKLYGKLKKSYLENIEDIELLRAIENDMKVYSFPIKGHSFSVDLNDDYIKAKIAMKSDAYRNMY